MARLSKLGFLGVEQINAARTANRVRSRVQVRGVPVALRDREVFATERPTEAQRLVGSFLGPTTLRVTETSTAYPFVASLNAVRVRDVTMAYLGFQAETELHIHATGDWYAVHMPTNREAECRYRGQVSTINPYSALVTGPGESVSMRFDTDSPQVIIRIEAAAIERNVARILGRRLERTVSFQPLLDLTGDPAVRWHSAMQLLSTEVLTPGSLIQMGAGAGQMEEFVVSTLLLIQPSNHHATLVRPQPRSGKRAVRRALAYIEANLAETITLEDLVAATGMSARSIQQGFREDLGTTPMAWIRDERLDRVHAGLVDGLVDEGVTVTSVAHEWGFTHLGNFAAMYRERFGVTPSQTLRG